MESTRRNFIKGATLASITAMGAGTLAHADEAQTAVFMPEAWDEEYDVVIVGGGGSGCAAANGAIKAGASVCVLESQSNNLGSSTAICGGYTMFIDSPLQRENGIEDSIDQFVADTMAYGESCKEDVLRVFAEQSPTYYDFVTNELGLEWTGVVSLSPGCSVPRTLTCDPHQHQDLIYQAAEDAGVAFKFETTGKRLYVDGSGAVVGVLAEDADGNPLSIKANKGVILASGGITHNAEMLEECMVGCSSIPAYSCKGHTAEMHRAAMQVGCQMYGRPWLYAVEAEYPGHVPMDAYAELYMYGAVEVNIEGNRYVYESIYWGPDRTRALLAPPVDPVDGICSWEIIDGKGYDAAVEAGPPLGIYPSVEELLVSADTLEELGEKINAPHLAESIGKYNEDLAANGVDSLFGRSTLLGEGTGEAWLLDTPPYYAFKNSPWFAYNPATSFYVDTECRALNSYDEPVEGLYMVGEIMLRTIVGNHYQYGLAVGGGCTLGFYCGGLVAQR